MSDLGKTRSQTPKTALEHLISILGKEPYQDIFNEAGINDIYDFLSCDPRDLKDLSCLSESGGLKTLKLAQIGRICAIQSWFSYQKSASFTLWFELTNKIIDQFIANPPSPAPLSVPTPDAVSSTAPSVSTTRTVLPGVRRNMSDYPKF